MNITEIKTQIDKIALTLIDKYDTIGVSIGLKEKGGKFTDEIAVVFHVNHKKNISELSPERVIPRRLTHLGIDVITDVNESANFNTLTTLTTLTNDGLGNVIDYDSDQLVDDNQINNGGLDMGAVFDLSEGNSNLIKLNSSASNNLTSAHRVDYWNDSESATIAEHRAKHRPLKGGTSSIYHKGSAATLGLIVSDGTDGSTVLLSNNHVYAASQFAGTDSSAYGSYGNAFPLSTIQPSKGDGGDPATDIVGKFKRVSPLKTTGDNFVDAAISTVYDTAVSDSVLNFNQLGPYEFATTDEIDSLLDVNSVNFKAPVFRSGRTLGPIGYPGNTVTQTVNRAVPGYKNLTDISSVANIQSAILERGFNVSQRDDTTNTLYNSRLIVKTTNKDYYVGGLIRDTSDFRSPTSNFDSRKYIPTNLTGNFTGEGLIPVGNFDYLNINHNATIGISANEIVYYTNFENTNNLYLNLTDGSKPSLGSLPTVVRLAQGPEFVKLQVPFDIDKTFSDKTVAFKLSTTAPTKPLFAAKYPTWSSMGELSGDYMKVSDDMFIRKPLGSESYNDMPHFFRTEVDTWKLSMTGGINRVSLGSDVVELSTWNVLLNPIVDGDPNITVLLTDYNQAAVDTPRPSQDLSGIKKITNGYYSSLATGGFWALSGEDIYTIGQNGVYNTLGTASVLRPDEGHMHNLSTKLPGKWKDIGDFGVSTVLALSTSGDLFYACPPLLESGDIYRIYPKSTASSDLAPTVAQTNSHELTANNISQSMFGGMKFKKIFTTRSYYWIYAIDENDDLYWLNIWYQAAVRISKNNTLNEKWNADITTCANPHGYSANHYFNEGDDLYFVNINGMNQRDLRDARDISQTSFLFDKIRDEAGISNLNATKISENYLSGSGTAFGWRVGGSFYDIDNFCGYDNTTNTWRVVGENLDNSFSDAEDYNDDIIVTDIGTNVRVYGFSAGSSVVFKDCISIRSKHGHFPVTAGGDSGSAVFAKFGNTWKVIGLVFAGPPPTNTARGIVCRIDRIQEQLNIKPWNGQPYNDSISTQILSYNTNKLAPSVVTLSGREFHNVGVESFI
tara:strand:+ start:755 stop:3955 length:3201 start_codon:yes stop_codon:yes gene_type:complete